MSEIWLPIKGYECLYEISNFGRIKILPKKVNCLIGKSRINKERISLGSLDKEGYRQFSLISKGIEKKVKVHRLVASHFINSGNDNLEVNHIDFNRSNNNYYNLEWSTRKENQTHTVTNNRNVKGVKVWSSRITIDCNTGIFYDTLKQACIAKCISYVNAKKSICKGIYKGLQYA